MAMIRSTLPWKLYIAFLVALLAFTLAVGSWVLSAQRTFHLESIAEELLRSAQLVEGALGTSGDLTPFSVDARTKDWGRRAGTRLTVIASDGRVLGDSTAAPALMENHASRPEVRAALSGGMGRDVRASATSGARTFYVAVPLVQGNEVVGAVRVALPVSAIDAQVAAQRSRLLAGASLFVLVAAVLGFVGAQALGRPFEAIQRGAERFAAGDLSRRLEVRGSRETTALAASLNRMAAELDQRMRTIERQATELEAILSSMSEGVLAVDESGRIISLNAGAARLLEVAPDEARGRPLQEIVRNRQLESLVSGVLATGEAADSDLVLGSTDRERSLQIHCTVLRDSASVAHGAVMVLADLTRLRHLETVRREFVANVSHELKTPVTSIKGFIETLRDGALHDPERAARFLEIVGRQAERLSLIIEDLLMLSRLEHEGLAAELPQRSASVRELLASAAQVCELKAGERDTPIRIQADTDLAVRMNPPLLEQAVVNLIDNAVNHSEPGNAIDVVAERIGSEVAIRVVDRGIGIEPEHLPRIFERFYRVDRARSRKAGGTGLGLAIVKHIAQVHGGAVGVVSEPGKGSTFEIRLPAGD
jgi:two-component system phosphate regulon sensor histidine kinase PhoR